MEDEKARELPSVRRIRGRPVGSVSIASRRAAKKLEQLGFDPISEMITLADEIEAKLEEMVNSYNEDGTPRKYSQMAYATLLTTRQRCISELMRYGYARAQEAALDGNVAAPKMTINLTASKVDFDTSKLVIKSINENEVVDVSDLPMKGPDE